MSKKPSETEKKPKENEEEVVVEPTEDDPPPEDPPKAPIKKPTKASAKPFNPMEGVPFPEGPTVDLEPIKASIDKIETMLGSLMPKTEPPPKKDEPKKEETPQYRLFDEFDLI